MIIYKAINKNNGKIYIGQTIFSLKKRIAGHLQEKRKSCLFPAALRKYNIQSFDISVIDQASSKEVLDAKEKYWIATHNCKIPNGYNLTDGGEGHNGYECSNETRARLSAAMKGNTNTFGYRATEETKAKKSKALIGKKRSDESRARMSMAQIGRKHSDESRTKMSIARMGNKCALGSKSRLGCKHTEEAKAKIRIARMGKKASEETKAKMSIAHMRRKWSIR